MSESLKVTAIILRRTNYKEADRILSVLTREAGQLAVIARGVRRSKSRLAGGIELFSECELTLARSSLNQAGMWTLTGARTLHFYDNIMTNYQRLQFGYNVIKQVGQLASQVTATDLYDTLRDTFKLLDQLTVDLRIVEIWYYLRFAAFTGNELNLLTDRAGMQLVEGATYSYNVDEEVMYFDPQGTIDTETIKLLRVLRANNASIAMRLADLDNATLNNACYLARVAAKQ